MCVGGDGDRLESPIETHLIFLFFDFLHVLLFLYGWGGYIVDIVCFIE